LNNNTDLRQPADTGEQRNRLLFLALCGITPFMVNGLVNSVIAHNALLYWAFEMLTWIVIPSTVLLLVMRTPGINFAALGYHSAIRGRSNIGLVLLACAVLSPLCYGVYFYSYEFFSALFPGQGFFQYESIVPESGILYFAVTLYFGLSAGLVEEFLFRGLLYRSFSGLRHSLALFLVISPILFSLVHWENGFANLASTYIVGIFMAIAYLGLRNLWPLMIGHIFTDLVWFG
jgi:membrane protease YdiL (CAAX protease family)